MRKTTTGSLSFYSYNKILLTFLSVFLFTAMASAKWIDTDGNNVADTEYRKSSGSLIARLVVTDNEKQLLRNWDIPSKGVYLPTTNSTQRNKTISVFVVFGGCAKDSKGNCDLRMQITIYEPDGSIYSRLPEMDAWSNKPAPPNKILGLSHGYIRVKVEDGEPLGEYKFKARITDYVSSQGFTLTSIITVTEENK